MFMLSIEGNLSVFLTLFLSVKTRSVTQQICSIIVQVCMKCVHEMFPFMQCCLMKTRSAYISHDFMPIGKLQK